MASLDYLREEMQRAAEIMDDQSKPFTVRHAARSRFWHCEKRVGTMVRGGFTEDDPGHYLIGYSEIAFAKPAPKAAVGEGRSLGEHRRELTDKKTEAHFAAKQRL